MTADALGGVWTYACELSRALAPHGVRVTLAVMGGHVSPRKRRLAEGIPGLELHQSRYRLEWMEDADEDVERAAAWLLALARRVRPDVVHLNGYFHGTLPWRAPVLMVGHSCVLTWWRAVHGAPAPERFGGYAARVRRALRAADAVVTPTLAHLHAMEVEYGPLRGARVIANGRDPSAYRPRPKRPYVLSVGRLWDEAKNIARLEGVAPALRWPVFVGGAECHPGKRNGGPAADGASGFSGARAVSADGAFPPVREDGAPLVPSPGVRPPVPDGDEPDGRGFVPLGELGPRELGAWYGGASIFALPARYEPFGLAPLEAGLAGCALVLGDLGTLREVWGDAALFVAPEDEEETADAVRRLIADPALRREMGRRARRRALAYGCGRMARGYLEIYRELRAGRRADRLAEAAATSRARSARSRAAAR